MRLDPAAADSFRPVWVAEYVAGRRRRSAPFDASREAHAALLRDGLGCVRAALTAAVEAVEAAREGWTVRRRAVAQRRVEEQSARARREILLLDDGDSDGEDAGAAAEAATLPGAMRPATDTRAEGAEEAGEDGGVRAGLRVERVRLDTGAMQGTGIGGRVRRWWVEIGPEIGAAAEPGNGASGRWDGGDADGQGDGGGSGWLLWSECQEVAVVEWWDADVVVRVGADVLKGSDCDMVARRAWREAAGAWDEAGQDGAVWEGRAGRDPETEVEAVAATAGVGEGAECGWMPGPDTADSGEPGRTGEGSGLEELVVEGASGEELVGAGGLGDGASGGEGAWTWEAR